MPIRKDTASGWHFIQFLVPSRENKRTRYQPQPLPTPQNKILGFLIDLLRGGPNPFLASPLAVSIDRRTKFERRVKQAARSETVGAPERLAKDVHTELDRSLRMSNQRADTVLDALEIEANNEEVALENCRPGAIRERLKSDISRVVNDVDGHLGPSAKAFVSRTAELDKFAEDHDLVRTRSVHWGRRISAKAVGIIILITILEFILNTAFFSGSQKSGMIGGAALAMLLSIATIFLGVFFGIAYQFADARADGRGWRGRIMLLVLTAATVFYLLLLTLARRAGEAGDLNMFETAAQQISERPFDGLLDLPALVYCFFTLGVIAYVSWKFIDTMGHFPRIRHYKLAIEDAESEYHEIRRAMSEELERRIDEGVKELEQVPSLVHARALALKEILVDYENVVYQFNSDVEEIEDAGDILIGTAKQYISASAQDFSVLLDSERHVKHFAERLAGFERRVEGLLRKTEISQSAIDRCRMELTNFGKKMRKELERRCDALIAGITLQREPRETPPKRPDDNVTWLSRANAK